ncbi:ParB N-terminal domain-containing protein, partial [Staphylococcus aureus]
LAIEVLPIGTIIPYARNPRRNKHAVAKVAGSIKEFGFRQPIVVDKEMVIIVGHTRLLAAQQLGFTHVPVHIAENLSPSQ